MKVLKTKYNLEDYDILSFSLSKKETKPNVFFIAKKDKKTYQIKCPFQKNNTLSQNAIKNDYEQLNKRYKNILNPAMINPYTLRTEYLFTPSVSHYLHNIFTKKKYITKVINWLVKFHNEDHKNGIGQIHGDLSAYDIIIKGKDVIVFDWEDYEKNREQLIDIYYLIFKETFSTTFLMKKEIDHNKFIQNIIGPKPHPYLKQYMQKRSIKYTQQRRINAFKEFIRKCIKKEEETFTIPRLDHYIYRQLKERLDKYLNHKNI